MRNDLIAKTLLSLYPGLNDYEIMLASRAQTHALCSYRTPLFTERIIDKIIDLNVKRQTIHNLKAGLDRILRRLAPDVQLVVRTYYQADENTPNVQVRAQQIGISERSYFRKLNAAVDFVARQLPQLGINFFTWQHLLQHHPWIKETFTRELQPNHRRKSWRRTE